MKITYESVYTNDEGITKRLTDLTREELISALDETGKLLLQERKISRKYALESLRAMGRQNG